MNFIHANIIMLTVKLSSQGDVVHDKNLFSRIVSQITVSALTQAPYLFQCQSTELKTNQNHGKSGERQCSVTSGSLVDIAFGNQIYV